jgi:predicted GNAT family N-acyltransferase
MPDKAVFRKADINDVENVRALVEEVFLEFVAPDFSEEGVREFMKYLDIAGMRERMESNHFTFVAELEHEIAGMIEIRNCDHISLLYVAKKHQRKGICKCLFALSVEECLKNQPQSAELTVNASLYAEGVYERLGFVRTEPEKTINGIRFIPMKKMMKK